MIATQLVTATSLGLVGVYLVLAVVVLAVALIVAKAARWPLASTVTLPWLLAFAWFEGWRACLALAGLVLAALAVGTLLRIGTRNVALAVACGLVVLGATTGWVLTLPIHHAGVWWSVVAVLVAWRHRAMARIAVVALHRWQVGIAAAPRSSVLAIMAVGLASTSTWLPNLQADDLAYHLQLPAGLLQDAVFDPDVRRQVWAYAPWLNDTLHGIVAVLGRALTHAPLNLLWLMLVGAMAWRLMRVLGAAAPLCNFGVAVACSVPMVPGVATGMHTELPATALTLALCSVVFAPARASTPAALAVLAGGLLALKGMHALAALPLLALGTWRTRAQWRRGVPMLLAAFALCASAYAHAFRATGNPVFPLMNGVFRSDAAVSVDFRDPRWTHDIGWHTPWQALFETTRFLESGDGALGMSAFVLAGGACAMVWRRAWIAPLLVTAMLILVPFALVQYARYVLPGIVCLSILALAACGRALGSQHATALAIACIGMHVLLLPAGNWLLSTSALVRQVASGGDDAALLRKFLPPQAALAQIPSIGEGMVLSADPDAPYVAPFGRRGASVSWYAPEFQAAARAADRDASGARWEQLLIRNDVAWVLVDDDNTSPALMMALRNRRASPYFIAGQSAVWRLPREAPR
ncbi:hypothetical protein LYSHEL_09770 [Lysobacter helvus]|uniref:Glycosyltransferase RgtA/B/C/D-like domain-containing protein n=2 Tax=Lysobacteraceae TaxID=32033 RepID=A0ABM7Q400_9GAMM|nr:MULTISPECIES: hypothetical protein [Lysobacter]BCT91953.1 hypothetical protein LYSCAS_09770 [Lysobacter caseinilyticus]BCT95106.1 hypothetical protein LYSHEL_09770 [Lysobacter helvus]